MENKNVCGLLGIETGTSANIKGADGQPAGRCGKKKKPSPVGRCVFCKEE